MAGIKCNGLNVFDATINRPAYGRWHARLRVDSASTISGPVVIETPGLTLRGVAVPEMSGTDTKVAELVVYGGAGGMTRQLAPKDYVGVTLGIVAADIARDAGETLSATIDDELLKTPVARWTRLRGNAGSELRALLDGCAPGKRWRILEDGTLWIGEHTWATSSFIHTLIDLAPTSGRKTIAVEKPFLMPGVTFEGDRIWEVTDDFSQPSIRQAYGTHKPTADVTRDDFELRAKPVVEPLRLYPARVLEASTLGGTLELRPDDERMPPMSRVPVRPGLPGFRVRLAAGARVLLMFENGDRRKPVVVSFEDGAISEISFDGGTKPIARVDDEADCGTLIVTPGPAGVASVVYVPPGGGVSIPAGGASFALKGKIKEQLVPPKLKA